MRELLVGCGSRRNKVIGADSQEWQELTTLDWNEAHRPDVVWDLNNRPLPFDDETFDEIHAYEVLEHLGNGIGDFESWFAEWSEWWRLLKPGGVLCGTSPAFGSRWVFGDPSHRRVVLPEMFVYLIQPAYTKQVGETSMSDFRNIYRADFDVTLSEEKGDTFFFALEAVKPSRITGGAYEA